MKKVMIAEARWDETLNRWKCAPQKDGRRKSFYEKTPGRKGKALCEDRAAEWVASHDVDDPRFDVAWDEYLEYRKKTVGTSAYTQEECFGRIWIVPAFGTKKLSHINSQDVQDLLQLMADKGKSKKTIKGVNGALSTFYAYCHKKRYEFEKPEVTIPDAAVGEKRVLQPVDVAKVFALSDDPWIYAYRFCLITGLRRGELVAMKWEDIKDGYLSLSRSVNRFNEITGGKNENARRHFALPRIALQLLEKQKEQQKAVTPWVWPDPETNDLADPGKFYNHWVAFLKRHDIPRISVHEMRHTMISMNKASMEKELLKLVVGHSASMDTFGVYGHEMDGDTETAAEVIDSVIEGIIRLA